MNQDGYFEEALKMRNLLQVHAQHQRDDATLSALPASISLVLSTSSRCTHNTPADFDFLKPRSPTPIMDSHPLIVWP